MGIERYKTSSGGRLRIYIQQTGISGNNAVLTARIAVKTDYQSATLYSAGSPRITVGGSGATGSTKTGPASSNFVEIYRRTGIQVAYASGATTGSVAFSASCVLEFFRDEDYLASVSESVSGYFDFDTRTISGSLTATNAALNAKPTFTIGNYSSNYGYSISYTIGNASGTVATREQITSGSYNGWTVPQDLGAQIQAGYTGTITYTLTTYSGSTAVGTATTTASITVPSYSYTVAAPTASKGSYSTIGAYVAGKTKVDFAVPAPPTASYGATYTYTATITQGSSTLASQAFTAAGTISATPTGTGTVTCTVTMTDSRGATKSNSASVTYVANTLPTVTLSAYRVGSSGSTTQDITGAYYYATASGTYNALTNNTCTLTLTTTSTGTASGSSGKVSKTASGSLATTNTLTVTAKVQDALGNVATATAIIPQGFAVVQFGTGSDHKGVSIGKVGQVASAGVLEVGYDAKIDGDLYVKGTKITPGGGGTGTITGVSVNGTSVATSGVANITNIPAEIVSGEVARATHATSADSATSATSASSVPASGITGTLAASHGGTGQTTLQNSANALINALGTGTSTPVDNDYYVSQYVGGGTTTTTFHRRPVSALWEYIKGKISSVLGLTATSYSGKASSASSADSATRATSADNVNAISTNSSDANGRWTANIPGITELTDGLTIKIRLTKSYNSTFNTLNVNSLGEKLVWYRSNSKLTSHIPQYGVIALTYYSGNTMGSSYAVSNAYASDYTDKGAWAASTAYAVGDKVTNGGTSYICKTAHTSASSFATTSWNTLTSPSSTLAKAKSATTAVTDGWFLEYQYQDGNDPNYHHRGHEIYQKSINNNMGRFQIVLTNRNGEIFPINSTNNSTSTSKTTFTTSSFAPEAKILYYTATTEYTTNQNWTSGNNFYDQHNNVDLRYSFNISSSVNKLTTYLPVYLVAVPQADGQFKLYYGANGTTYSACLTQTLPSTEDGLVYIMLGMARSTYQINLWLNKPMYWYKNGSVREYVAVVSSSAQTIVSTPLTASAISASNSSAICTLTNRSYTLNNTEVYINVQCVLSSGVSLAGNDWWRLVRDFPMPKDASASTSDMGVSLNAVLYKSDGNYAGQVDAHIAYHTAETNRPAGWYLRVHTNVAMSAGMKIIASGSYLI